MAPKSSSEQAGILLWGKIFSTVAEAVAPLIIVRLLGKVEVGSLVALLLLYNTVLLVAMMGFPTTLAYFLPSRGAAERRAITRHIALVMSGVGVVAGLLLYVLSFLDPDAWGVLREVSSGPSVGGAASSASLEYLAPLALLPVVDLPARILPELLVVEGRARASAVVSLVRALGSTLATLVPLALGFGVWTVVFSLVAFGWVQALLVPFYLGGLYAGEPRVPSPVRTRELFRFAVPLGFTTTMATINNRLDRYLILFLFSAVAFAEYQAGAWQVPMITAIPAAVGTAYAPRFAELFKKGEARRAVAIWRDSVRKVSLLVMPITMIFVVAAEETMELLFTADYLRGAWVFRLYSMVTLGRVAIFGTIIVAAGHPGFVFRASVLSLFANLALSIPLVYVVGFEGPALGTLLAFIPTVVIYCWYIARATGLRTREIFPLVEYSKLLAIAAVSGGVALLFKLSCDFGPAVMLAAEAVIVLATFAALGSLLGKIERSDWQFAWSWMRLGGLR
jgi:O-antigen/teichoic acid export membrane protein